MANILIVALAFTLLAPIRIQNNGSKQDLDNPMSKTAGGSKAKEKPELFPLQKSAVDLIDQLSQTAKQIDDELVKIRVRAVIADTLWEYNKDRSRKLFEEVFDASVTLLAERPRNSQTQSLGGSSPEYQLWDFLMRLISRRDPDLAEKLLLRVAENQPQPGNARLKSLPLEFASHIADTDPARAAKIITNSLAASMGAARLRTGSPASGINPQIFRILTEMRKTDAALADRLCVEVLDAALSDSSFTISQLQSLSTYIVPALSGDAEMLLQLSGAKMPGPQVITRYLQLAYETIIHRGGGTPPQTQQQQVSEYSTLQTLLPYFNQYLPDKADAVAARMRYLYGYLPESALKYMTDPMHPIDDLLEKARTATSTQERDRILSDAAIYTSSRGHAERALSIAKEIQDEAQRSQLESGIRNAGARRALAKGDLDTAYRYAKDITNLRSYGMIFGLLLRALSDKISGQKDKQKAEESKQWALSIISEVERFLVRADHGSDNAFAALAVTTAAVSIYPNRAFDLMQWTVKALNYADPDGKERNTKGDVVSFIVSSPMAIFAESFTPLAKSAPDRALWLAQSLVRKELKILAQLAVCQGMLTKKEEAESAPAPPTKEGQKKAGPIQRGDKEAPITTPGKKKTF